jgi:hypothetical protein
MKLIKLKTFLSLGIGNLVRVAIYRLGLKTGLGRVLRVQSLVPNGPFFTRTAPREIAPAPSLAWQNEAIFFGCKKVPLNGEPPDWFYNPYSRKRISSPNRPWWEIPDFDPDVGDIKVIWEPSRFDWLVAAATRAATGQNEAWEQIEEWLVDWCNHNPPYMGPNWKCGQEASIRVMHLAMAALILDNHLFSNEGLLDLVEAHLKRIEPTVQYAIGQDNNHGTSEAAALFIGGAWLQAAGRSHSKSWTNLGRQLIDNRVLRLVSPDGSFSQYSLTYHRLLLDTFIMVEVWRLRCGLADFPSLVRERIAKATEWLFTVINPKNGDGPNLGANDGARLLPLTDSGYRDFRPTVQTAMVLFRGQRAYADSGIWDAPLSWFGLTVPKANSGRPTSTAFDDGGYAVLHQDRVMVLMRYPRFRFRPAQADAFHVDLWVDGTNFLRDAGTFSYNHDVETLNYFGGTEGHNTVMFDQRDQMPRLGRFLFGEWLTASDVGFDKTKGVVTAGYKDWKGASHNRELTLSKGRIVVIDKLAGQFSSAVLRWRLSPGIWACEGQSIANGVKRINIVADVQIRRMEIVCGFESLHYQEKNSVQVLEVEVSEAGAIKSEIIWE